MKFRNILFEFEDLSWFPHTIRESMTDYLRYILTACNFYEPITALLMKGMEKTNSTQIIDLCSGGGGAIEQIGSNINSRYNTNIKIILTDKYPNISAFELLATKTNNSISFSDISVDATDVPNELHGLRTVFSGFHHFDATQAKAVLQNAVSANQGIAIFDGGDKNIMAILGIIFFHPIVFLLFTPFFRPWRISRIIFTYIIPIIPVCTIWDGVVSITRLYQPDALLRLAKDVDDTNYIWTAGKVKNRLQMNVTYLLGYPKELRKNNHDGNL